MRKAANVLGRRPLMALLLGAGLLSFGSASAAPASPVGKWTTVDDDGKTPKSVVEIVEKNGVLEGKILELINPSKKDPVCEECEGTRKNQKIVGMTILWGMKRDGDKWTGGHILDPKNGKTYGCKMEVVEGGKRLEVRGFIGISLLGRTQYWLRRD